MRRQRRVGFGIAAACLAVLAVPAAGSPAPDLSAGGSACPRDTVAAVIGGKRVCLKFGIRCDRRYQAQYVRNGFRCNARGRLGLLVCTGGSVYGVIGGVHGCLRERQPCQARHATSYVKLGFECERGRLVRTRSIDPRITIAGPEEVVFDWSRDRCEDADIPDLPARAFRDADGNVQLIASHYSTRRFVGPDFGHLTHDCTVVLGSNGSPDPAAFDDKQWLAAVYTNDGRTIYGLTHVEYQGNTHPGQCPSLDYFRCWWNTLALVVSTDGGRTYRRHGPRNGLVASIPFRYVPDLGVEGHRSPSQIVRNPSDGYYYATVTQNVMARPGVAEEGGNCLIRTRNLADPTSWRAPDEGGEYTRRFVDPYTQAAVPSSAHLCGVYIRTRPGCGDGCSPLHPSLTWNTHLQRWLLIGSDQVDVRSDPSTTKWGVYFSVSRDLVTWTTQKLVLARNMAFVHNCGDPDPIMYPTLLDHASPSRNFETTGSTAYLYYTITHFEGCNGTLDRNLVRVPVTISK